jgi:hypothetical protein
MRLLVGWAFLDRATVRHLRRRFVDDDDVTAP